MNIVKVSGVVCGEVPTNCVHTSWARVYRPLSPSATLYIFIRFNHCQSQQYQKTVALFCPNSAYSFRAIFNTDTKSSPKLEEIWTLR